MPASQELKRLIALQAASGHAVSEIAKHHKYTYQGMWKLLQRPEMQQMVAEQRQHMQEVYQRVWQLHGWNGYAWSTTAVGETSHWLTEGWHTIEVRFDDWAWYAIYMEVEWEAPSMPRQPIPTSHLRCP